MFQKKFKEDFSLFLALRSEELVSGGCMVLTFLGRKSSEMLAHGDVDTMWELLAEALQILVQKVFSIVSPPTFYLTPEDLNLIVSMSNKDRIKY